MNTPQHSLNQVDFPLEKIQQALEQLRLDGWLLYDFRGSNPVARSVLLMQDHAPGSRRWFYWIPRHGKPIKLVHRIEPSVLDHLPGEKLTYLRWQQLHQRLRELVGQCGQVAMEYSPFGAIPYIALVDAGTVELVRSLGPEVVSSGDLVQMFEATWEERQWALHQQACRGTVEAFDVAWDRIAQGLHEGSPVTELEVQQLIMDHLSSRGLVWEHPPIVATGPHSADPHYEPTPGSNARIGPEQVVLIDLWAKVDDPQGVYSDLTCMAYTGSQVPEELARVFAVVVQARQAAVQVVQEAMSQQATLYGWQVDEAARKVITQAGFGEAFLHRTGHSIGRQVHGNGANMDNLETHELRRVLPGCCFSVEPGIYLPGRFGMRSEVNVYIDPQRQVHITGRPQQELELLGRRRATR